MLNMRFEEINKSRRKLLMLSMMYKYNRILDNINTHRQDRMFKNGSKTSMVDKGACGENSRSRDTQFIESCSNNLN